MDAALTSHVVLTAVAIVTNSGGDIVKFVGDALIVLFQPPRRNDADEEEEASDVEVATALHRATQCALQIQRELHNYALADDVRLSVKLGLGAGQITIVHVGGVYQRLEYIVTGPPLVQARASNFSHGTAIFSF